MLSDKIKHSEKITLVEQRETPDTDGYIDDDIVNDDAEIAVIFNRFFSNAVNDLKIAGLHGAVSLANNISHPISRVILKYTNHSSTIAINDLNNTSMFTFSRKKLENVTLEKQLKIPTNQPEY